MKLLGKTLCFGTLFFSSHFAYGDLNVDNQTEGKHEIEAFYVPDSGTGFAGYRFTIDKNPVLLFDFAQSVAALFDPKASKDAVKQARNRLAQLALFPEEEGEQTITFLYSQLCPEGALTAQLSFGSELVTFCLATDPTIAKGKLWIAVIPQPTPET
jgi:hypothetical protein